MLDLNLLSLPVVLFLCAVVSAGTVFLSTRFDRSWYFKRLPLLVLVTFTLTYLGKEAIVRATNSPGELPPHFMLVETPLAAGLCLAASLIVERLLALRRIAEEAPVVPDPVVRKAKTKAPPYHSKITYLMTGFLIAGSLLFALGLINRYYRYYPTLGSVFGQIPASDLIRQKAQPAGHVDKESQIRSPQMTIQGSLESLHRTTDGSVYSVSIPGKVSGFQARDAWVYEPPIALSNAKIALPVLVLLPGEPGKPADWLTGGGAAETANAFAKTHDGIAPLIVMVDDDGSVLNDTECVNSPWGNVETYLTADVPKYIKKHFVVSADPAQWAIGGFSMGGTCSIMLALGHPELYHYFMDLSGEMGPEVGSKEHTIAKLFHDSPAAWAAHQPSLLLQKRDAPKAYRGMGGFFADGKDDQTIVTSANSQLYALAKMDGLDVVSESPGGKHNFALWKQAFSDALPWLSNRLGATVCQTVCGPAGGTLTQKQ